MKTIVAYIGDIVEQIPCFSPFEINRTVDKLFSENTRIQGIVVVNNEVPISFISRIDFYQKIGTQYGYNLYFKAYNDTYGLKKGDKLLQSTAELLKREFANGPPGFPPPAR